MKVEFDVAKMPDGEVEVLSEGIWKSVEITDIVFIEEMVELEKTWKFAEAFRFKHNGRVYYWKRGAVLEQ